jgi:hypothetical protein
MAKNFDTQKPFMFSKLDIKDGFWRMAVNDENAWNFYYVLPGKSTDIDDTSIVVPNSLQMGWCESPPFFCAGTETAHDIIDDILKNNKHLQYHHFEKDMI